VRKGGDELLYRGHGGKESRAGVEIIKARRTEVNKAPRASKVGKRGVKTIR